MSTKDKERISPDLRELVLAIGHSKSREEEEAIMMEETQLLITDLKALETNPNVLAERMMRILYLHLLGFDASFAYIYAINLSQNANVRVKRLGYLVCATCLPRDSQLLILLVSSLQRDLVSADPLCISAALCALTSLATPTMMHALLEIVSQLLHHSLPLIKSKAAAVLHRFADLDDGLAAAIEPEMYKMLTGDDMTCLMAALNFYEMLFQQQKDKLTKYKFIVKPLSAIIRALVTKNVPQSYYYHNSPAPWVQIQAMKVMSLIGSYDYSLSIQVANVLLDALRHATATQPLSNISQAIIYQIHLTASSVKSCDMVLTRTGELLSDFVTSKSCNLVFAGVTGLMRSFKTQPNFILRHQLRILSLLEDPDVTIRNGTLKVLISITRPDNAEIVTEKVLSILPNISEEFVRSELIEKLAMIADMYAPSLTWKFDTYVQLLLFHEQRNKWTQRLATRLIQMVYAVKDSDQAVVLHALSVYRGFVTAGVEDRPSDLLKAAIWTIGEFSSRLEQSAQEALFLVLSDLLLLNFEDAEVTHWLLSALQKMYRPPLSDEFRDKVNDCASSMNDDTQQRCYEFAKLCFVPDAPRVAANSLDFNCGSDLSFLEAYANSKANGQARDKPKAGKQKREIADWKYTYGKALQPKLTYTAPQTIMHGSGSRGVLENLWGYLYGRQQK